MMSSSNVSIKAIEASAIHQIQSGQVIVDLCSVAKELIENSIDAGATSIEVRFKNQGLDSIEVQDNGAGISSQNYETLALKHYTSKLSTYDDLGTLQTFGFRGEALSSMCALSTFSVVTCLQEEAPKAKRLEFESSGKLRSTAVVSGHKGTTVIVEGLFRNLPVRRRELERNIKREWGKVINLLNQYACALTAVRFSVSQQPNKGKRMVLFSTKGNRTTRENIINVFGVKAVNPLIPMDLRLELVPTTTTTTTTAAAAAASTLKAGTRDNESTAEIFVRGHVSRPAHGEGRQAPDRQMFYVNGRPCGLPQFAKVFNEVYRSYNLAQSPFIFADIQLDTHLYDVNVSPDKRTILLHDQGQMLDNLRESLVELFEKQDVTVPVAQLSNSTQTPFNKGVASTRSATPASNSREASARASVPALDDTSSSLRGRHAGKGEDRDGEEEELEGDQDGDSDAGRGDTKVSSKLAPRDTQSTNLISRWAEKRADVRENEKPRDQGLDDDVDEVASPREKPRLFDAFERRDSPDVTAATDESEEQKEDNKPLTEDITVTAPGSGTLPDPSKPSLYDTAAQDAGSASHIHDIDVLDEPPIPAVPPPTQSRPNLTPTKSPKRTAPQIATIQIGDDTITSTIGPPAKRLKATSGASKPAAGKPTTKKAGAKPSSTLPSFRGRLTQMFAAAAASSSREDIDDSELDEEDGEEDEEDEGGEDAPGTDEEEGSPFVSEDEEQAGIPREEGSTEGDSEPTSSLSHEDGRRLGTGVSSNSDAGLETEEATESADVNSSIGQNGGDEGENGNESEDEDDYEYMDDEKETPSGEQEAPSVEELIKNAKKPASETNEDAKRRSRMLLKRAKRKDSTLQLVQQIRIDEDKIREQMQARHDSLAVFTTKTADTADSDGLEVGDAEEKLSLKISKSDFGKMRIIGQFNLGFIIAVREAEERAESEVDDNEKAQDDELFIIDQHASDEKYNFERLQANTVVQSQRLVQPKTLELTALEEEVVMENVSALETNGFNVKIDGSGNTPVGSRIQLLSLPLSRETTFSLTDLEELIFLLADNPTSSASTVPRPSKVRKMFAMRACRSSIMIGKALSGKQMENVVRHMGEMEKPWNCPHGRPTMRHLCGLSSWEERGWLEGDGFYTKTAPTDWAGWLREKSME